MEDNLHLMKLAKAGDMSARDMLVSQNMGLVTGIAKRYQGRGQELCDLVQIGVIGLIKAIDRFDEAYDVKLSTYAVPMIQGEIRRFLRDDGIIKVSRRLKEICYKAEKLRMEYLKSKGYEPAVNEVCSSLDISPEELMMAMDCSHEVSSIDDVTEGYFSSSDDDEIVDRLCISQILARLLDNERTLIRLRYFENKTQNQTGKILGISQVQVSRLEKRILKKLKEDLA